MSKERIFMTVLIVVVAIAFGTYIAFAPRNLSASRDPSIPIPEEIIQQNFAAEGEAEIYLAGGCFWGMEFLMRNVPGVVNVEVGYANGLTRSPNYRQVCKGSGHAETAHVIYNTNEISLTRLLDIYYKAIDPTLLNLQGEDSGIQYRTGIYYSNPEDAPVIEESLSKLQGNFLNPVVVEHEPIKNFYRAEENHQQYLLKNPNGYCHISRNFIDEQAKEKVAQALPNKNFSRDRIYGKPSRETLKNLSELQRAVTQDAATEPPFRNEYDEEFRTGIYVDVTTGQPLFSSKDKFESSCGWPAFTKPIDESFLEERNDISFGIERTEVIARASRSHLGHVFRDEPGVLGGVRYCINSAALRFIPQEKMQAEGYGDWLNLFSD